MPRPAAFPAPLPSASSILGTMTFGDAAQVKEADAERIIEAFVGDRTRAALGPNARAVLDTARIYQMGNTHEVLGRVLARRRDLAEKVDIHTKAHPIVSKLTEDGVRAQLESSLKALGRDKVQVWYLHSPDTDTPLLDTLKACKKLHDEGLFDELGLSAYPAWAVVQAHYLCDMHGLEAIKPRIYQGVYNALARDLDAELLPAVRTFGMRCVVYNPLAAGVLADRYKTVQELTGAAHGRFSAEFDIVPLTAKADTPMRGSAHKLYRQRYGNESLFQGVSVIRDAVNKAGVPMADASLRWALHHSELRPDLGDAVIYGVSSLKQAQLNIAAANGAPLAADVVAAYEDAGALCRGTTEGYFRGYDAKTGSAKAYLSRF